MVSCVVCSKRPDKKSKRSFHVFPFKKRPDNADKWVKWVRSVKNPGWTPSKRSIICSDHFTASDFNNSTFRVELNGDSVPTITSPNNRTFDKGYPKVMNKSLDNLKQCLFGIKRRTSAGSLQMHDEKDSISMPEFVTTGRTSDPTTCSALEAHASESKSASHEINTPTTPNKRHGKKGTSTPDPSTSNVNELPATKIFSTPEKNLPSELNDECDVTPGSSASNPLDKCSPSRRRSLFLHDHNYENTPTACRRQVFKLRENLQKARAMNKAQERKIKRLKKRVESLKALVGKLRKERSVCEDGLEFAKNDMKYSCDLVHDTFIWPGHGYQIV